MNEQEVSNAVKVYKNIKAFNTIAQTRRLNPSGLDPELSSEDLVITNISFPSEGGTLTNYEKAPPFKGFIDQDTFNAIRYVKKLLISQVVVVLKNKINILFLSSNYIKTVFELCHESLHLFLLKEDKYCHCVREVRRSMSKVGFDEKYIDVVSMILEFDDAYRYRFQDVVSELNQNNISIKEVKRLISLLENRENNYKENSNLRIKLKTKWKLLRFGCNLLYFNKDLRFKVLNFLKELNLWNIYLDEDDMFHARKKFNYNW